VNRRGFMGTILAAAVAPAIVRVDSLMALPKRALALPGLDWTWTTDWATEEGLVELWGTRDGVSRLLAVTALKRAIFENGSSPVTLTASLAGVAEKVLVRDPAGIILMRQPGAPVSWRQ
jgi:hypothetical protein